MLRTELQSAIVEAKRVLAEAQSWAKDLRQQHSRIKAAYGDRVEQERLWKELGLYRSIVESGKEDLESLRVRWIVGDFEEDADGAAVVRYNGRVWLIPAEPERSGDDIVRLMDLENPGRTTWAHGDDLEPVIKPVINPPAERTPAVQLELRGVR